MRIDHTKLKMELVRQNLTFTDLARRLGRPVTTVSSWLRGVHPGPMDLVKTIEAALGVAPGTLDL